VDGQAGAFASVRGARRGRSRARARQRCYLAAEASNRRVVGASAAEALSCSGSGRARARRKCYHGPPRTPPSTNKVADPPHSANSSLARRSSP
jgi:hypothetical protein